MQNYNLKFKIFSFSLLLLIIACYLLPISIHAQEASRTITIVPPSESISVNPGDKKEGILKVINDSDTPLTFTAQTQDFIVEDTKGTPDFLPKDTLGKPYSAAAWIGIVPDSFTIAPHQKQLLTYYLQVPIDARPGGHYAGIIYTPTNLLAAKGSGPSVQTQIGTLFSIDVSGPIHEQAYVTKFTTDGFYEYGPANIMTQIKNLGDLHIKPLGTITIYDVFGRKIGTIGLNEHNIFPMAARDYVNVFGQTWMLGPFTAKLAANYGRNDNLTLLATTTFWVFPWKVAVVIILLIVAGVLGWMVWKRRQEEGKNEVDKETPTTPSEPTTQVK